MLRARIWTVVVTQTHRDASGWARTGMMPCAPKSFVLIYYSFRSKLLVILVVYYKPRQTHVHIHDKYFGAEEVLANQQ